MKKGLIAGLVSVLLVFSLGALAGCVSPQDEEEFIRENLAEQLDKMKNADEATIQDMVSDIESGVTSSELAVLEQMGLSSEGIARSIMEGFDYTINKVTVNGNEAVANVTVKAKDFGDFMTDLTAAANELMADPSQVAGMSQDDIMALLGDKVQGVLANMPLHESTVDMDFEKTGNTWDVTDEGVEALSSVFSL